MRRLVLLLLASSLPLSACDRGRPAPDGASPGASANANATSVTPRSSSAPRTPTPATSSSAQAEPESLQLLKLTMTSAVKNKEPVDEVTTVAPGQRIYAHFKVRNRTGFTRTLDVRFRVNGVERSTVSLEVEPSWSWRTWAYNTVLPTDAPGAAVEMDATDDTGAEIATAKVTVRAAK